MQRNSRFITSNQTGIHDQLHDLIQRRAASDYLKPIAPSSRLAFNTALGAWRNTNKSHIIIDAGCGVGLSTRRLATLHPDHFVIGIDQSSDRLSRQVEWPSDAPNNFITVRADVVDFWRLLRDAAIYPSHHYLLYPNPWPKKHHLARRWHAHPRLIRWEGSGGGCVLWRRRQLSRRSSIQGDEMSCIRDHLK